MLKFVALTLLITLSGAAHAGQFSLRVDAADADGRIRQPFVYDASGCHGDNVSPALAWSDAPKGTSGFAVTVYDPDAADGWWHWIVLDIPLITHQLKQGEPLPPSAFALANSFGHTRWDGPCPPKADPPHHYVFTVYALDTAALGLTRSATPAAAKAAIEEHAIDKASVTLTYGR